MANNDDMDLVREYVVGKSDHAFAAIVAQHINLVYSAALRQTGDFQQAEEVTQAVFLILARKAGSLHPGTILSGWLYKTAQFTAANARRAAILQHRREKEAQMQFMQTSESDHAWRQLAPVLEEAMCNLGQKERDAIVLRYFENRTVGEVAAALRINVAAAQKRVNRGTEKLRRYFVKRGVPISTAVLSAAIGTNAVHTAPAVLVSTMAAKSAAVGSSTLALTHTTLKLMSWAQAKMTALIIAATFGATAAATIAVEAVAAPAWSHVQFEGEGFLLHRNLAPDGTVGLTWTNYFKVTVRDGAWRIVTQRDNQKPDFTEVSYDGDELIGIDHFENYAKEQIRQGGTIGFNSAVADVQYFPVPYSFMDAGALPIWFAYASQSYLDNAPPGYLVPLNNDPSYCDMVRLGYEQKAQLTRRPARPGLPERAVLFNPGRFPEQPFPFNEGFTNSIFQVLAFTNLAGMDIPTHFTFSYYTPKHDGTSSNDIRCASEEDFQLTNLLSRISVTHFRPEFPKGIVIVNDLRFCGQNPCIPIVEYFSTNSGWLTAAQVKRLPAFQREAELSSRLGPFHIQHGELLDAKGKSVDLQHYPSFHPLNFPRSLRTHYYPNTILFASLLSGAILICAFLLRMAARCSNRHPK